MTAVISAYENFPQLRTAALLAGFIGVLQSLLWIGLTITAIASYNCVISYPIGMEVTDKTAMEFTLYEMYFKSEICTNPSYVQIQQSEIFKSGIEKLKQLKTVLNSEELFIWICVYLGVCVIWFMMSLLLMINVKKDYLHTTKAILHLWMLVTLSISAMDLALGVIFGIDFSRFSSEADNQGYAIHSNMTILILAQVISFSMMIAALKGFVLWIINVSFICYFFKEALVISKAMESNKTSYFNKAYQNTNGSLDSLAVKTNEVPIQAYNKKDLIITQGPFRIEERTNTELNFEPIERASRLSSENLQERRLRNLNSYQQYPPPTNNLSRDSDNLSYPAPDYTPPMPRSTRPFKDQLQSSRYQQ